MSNRKQPHLLLTAIRGRCPNCGQGKLFAGFLDIQPACDHCHQNFGFADSGDGPAFLIIILVGFLVVGGALATDVIFEIPYWLHLVIWLPMILILSIGLLRPLKALMIGLQFRNNAKPGVQDTGDEKRNKARKN